MGPRPKLLESFRGRPMIEYVLDASREWQPAVVASEAVAQFLANRADITTIVNAVPERGMVYSLMLANAALPKDVHLIVLLADKPLVTSAFIAQVCETAADADVAYPVHEESGEPGHPVVFSPRARSKIAQLPDGDTLRKLRDDPSLTRRIIKTSDAGAFFDVDTLQQLSS
jgi:CTP:molybdopterin cytidylyltransferase MocA